MTSNNKPFQKHIFKISENDFYNAWKLNFEQTLRMAHESQYEIADQMGLEVPPYDQFCKTVYSIAPKAFETRDN